MKSTKKKHSVDKISLSYIKHLIKNRKLMNLLIRGSKNSNKHTINIENAKKWIEAQTTDNRKLAAESIINTVDYIPHKYLLHTLKKTVDIFIKTIKLNTFVIVTEEIKKSGFLFTILFCYYLHKKNKQIFNNLIDVDINIHKLYKIHNTNTKYIFINDMDYTGNQSINKYKKIKYNIDIINVRMFQSTVAFDRYVNLQNIKVNITNIVGEVLPTLLHTLKITYPKDYLKRYKEICRYWGLCPDTKYNKKKYPFNYGVNCSMMNVYFDHKIADPPSTLLLPLITGYVPIDDDYKYNDYNWCGKNHLTDDCDEENSACIKPRSNGNIRPHKHFYALINKCKYGKYLQEYVKKYDFNIFDLTSYIEEDTLDIRCPFSWYKKIDYNIGRFTYKSKREI